MLGRRHTDPLTGIEIDVLVQAVGALGDGVARYDDRPIYIPAAAPGDRLRVRLTGRRGDGLAAVPLELVAAGPSRVEPPCRHFGACGGCLLQHLRPDDYRVWKRGLLRAALDRHGFNGTALAATVEVPPGSRRRAVLAARRGRTAVFLGFNEHRSHRIVDLSLCLVLRPEIVALLPPLRIALRDLMAESEAMDVVVTLLEDGLDLVLRADRPAGLADRERLAAFAADHDLARLSWRQGSAPAEPLAHRRSGFVRFGSVAVTVPPGAFLQATAVAETALARATVAAVATAEAASVIDLFAGSGALSFPVAERVPVHAVDAVPEAVAALRAGAATAGLTDRNITAEIRDLYRDPVAAKALAAYGAIVFDPPRAGGRAQTAEIAASGVPLVVAVSCSPASFAADARQLVDVGYRLDVVTPVDQFLWAPHLELIGVFRR